MESKTVTTTTLLKKKQKGEKITVLTAYDYPTAKLLDEAGLDIALVGDSLGQVVLGYDSTLPVTLEDMVHHTKAVVRGTRRAMVVADMPFMSYQAGPNEAVANAGYLIQEAAAISHQTEDRKPVTETITIAVKLEGGEHMVSTIVRIVEAGIPVMGHLGMLPMSATRFGGARVHGKTKSEAERILRDAKELEEAGVFAIVLELVPKDLAKQVTDAISVPTIGIGAGPHCDGHVLVTSDLLGLYGAPFKHVKQYADLSGTILQAFKEYAEDVRTGKFPGEEHSF
ncbi:MAG TPA: 3-methyl-2-oxobutanoate hydroxymethyltransferase [Armatimonadota bacterium]|nr:3-methyl-2-oxobutanoate hydroxymethyltransferase [Armatimonadota bacterium]